MTGMISCSTDKRGKHPKPKKIERSIIINHIESYNPSIAHYRREHAPNRRYLPNDVTIKRINVKHTCIWLDNCSAQNKNWILFTFLVYRVNHCPQISVDTIDIFFFEPTCTFMAVDSFHHQVELAMKHSGKVYDFQDFVQCVQQANSGKVDTKELGVGELFAWEDLTSKQKLKLRGDNVPYLTDVVKVNAK
ncbi:hypothetical protein AVEN_61152-1 [Araneus ventricosus]|uniref:Uncharacterized protein n=1 Tax=Araneus ventricosus TaxID=182803 RepID=A0A4Y2X4E1_ARAVE|nr:hypothetical protein AVEN_138389-1 [Araneus ventricosus]GBO44066.1 hypothetical protein AVEN_61152-1 [Araneus ventricosus]